MMKDYTDLIDSYEKASEMEAIGFTKKPEIGEVIKDLELLKVDVPKPKEDEVVIKVMASAIFADEVYAAQGTALGRFFGPKNVTPENPYVFGSSIAGVIVAIGEKVSGFGIGQEIISIPSQTPVHGAWATYSILKYERLMEKPKSFSFTEAAGIKLPACVSYGAIKLAKVVPGSRIAIVGASGGLGIICLQYLKARGNKVTAICSKQNHSFVKSFGADEVIDYSVESYAKRAVKEGIFYDYVFDFVGGEQVEREAFRALKRSGKFITVTGPVRFIGEKKLSFFKVLSIFSSVIFKSIKGRIVGPRYVFGEMKPSKVIGSAFNEIENNNIQMPISETVPYDIEAIKNALNIVLNHKAKGRIVIKF